MAARPYSLSHSDIQRISAADYQPFNPSIRDFVEIHIQNLKNNKIETLDLYHTGLRHSEFNALIQALKENTSLCTLKLQRNLILTEQAIALVDSIRDHPKLVEVDLRDNLIELIYPDSRKAMKSALKRNKSLKVLHLNENTWEYFYYPNWTKIREILLRSIPTPEIEKACQELRRKVAIKIKSSTPKQDPSVDELKTRLTQLSNEITFDDERDNKLLYQQLVCVYHCERFLKLIRKRLPESPPMCSDKQAIKIMSRIAAF